MGTSSSSPGCDNLELGPQFQPIPLDLLELNPKPPKKISRRGFSTHPKGISSLRQQAVMTPLFRKILGMNWVLILTMYGLLIFGVFAIDSAARHLPVPGGGDGGDYYSGMHKVWMGIGTVIYFGVALIDYRWVRWLGVPMYVCLLYTSDAADE